MCADTAVRFAMDRAGLVGADGATHCGFADVAYMSCLPNMVVMAVSLGSPLSAMAVHALWPAAQLGCSRCVEQVAEKHASYCSQMESLYDMQHQPWSARSSLSACRLILDAACQKLSLSCCHGCMQLGLE